MNNNYLVMYQAIFFGKHVAGDCSIAFGKKLQHDNIDELRDIIANDIRQKEDLTQSDEVKIIFTSIFNFE